MCLVLKIHQPFLCLCSSILICDIHWNHNTAGIDLLALLLIVKLALLLQFSHRHQSKIHKTDKFILSALKDLLAVRKIFLICFFHRLFPVTILKCNLCKLCRESGMAAVIRPIGIQNPNLCHGRISLFLIFKILLNMKKILKGHRQIQRTIQLLKRFLLHLHKSVKNCHICRLFKFRYQSFGLLHICLPRIHGINTVTLNARKLLLCDHSLYHIGDSRANHWCLFFI